MAPTIASSLACFEKHTKFLGVGVVKSRGGVRGFFLAVQDVPNHMAVVCQRFVSDRDAVTPISEKKRRLAWEGE